MSGDLLDQKPPETAAFPSYKKQDYLCNKLTILLGRYEITGCDSTIARGGGTWVESVKGPD